MLNRLLLSISITVFLSACNNGSDIAERPYQFSGTKEDISFSDRIPVINELPIQNVKESTFYRFWFYCHYEYLVLTITRNKAGKSIAHFCYWNGGSITVDRFKTWQRELNSEETSRFFELIKSSKFWQTNETIMLPMRYLSTGCATYEIEAKDKNKIKIAGYKREYKPEYKSVYEDLTKEVFALVGEPTPDLPR
jgi:hypothetical protein